MSLITMLASVAKKIEAIQCKLLWGDSEENRRYRLVAWDVLKRLLNKGGLGLKSMVEMNKAVQGKWVWHFMKDRDALWSKGHRDKV